MFCFAFSLLNAHTWISYFTVDHGGHLMWELFDCAVNRFCDITFIYTVV